MTRRVRSTDSVNRREQREFAKAFGVYHPPWDLWWRLRVLRAKVWHWRRNGHQWL